jgi:quercetin dioxygenase-like cupin family protein
MQFSNLSEIKERELIPGFHGRVIHSDRMTFVYWLIDEGAPLPEHSHPHEQVAHVFEGEIELTVDGVTRTLGPGTVTAIPSNALHSGKAITQCRILDVFSPVREDYR